MQSIFPKRRFGYIALWAASLILLLNSCATSSNNASAPTEAANATIASAPLPTSTLADQPTLTVENATATSSAPGSIEVATATTVATTAVQATATSAAAQNVTSFPDPQKYNWKEVVTGLSNPVDMRAANGDSSRLYVVEKRGMIQLLVNGKVQAQPFLDILSKVNSKGNEQGLLGLAFDPQYAQNGYFFVNYIDLSGNTVIARYSVTKNSPDLADNQSEMVLLHIQQPYENHNGGDLMFGPDGYLYAGMGDGGSAGDPHGNGQSTNVLLGKMLRIDVHNAAAGQPYSAPADNVFVKDGKGLPEIWAYGLRNPWRFSFDMANGDLYIADVGQDKWEEIDYLPANSPSGANFGWNLREGKHDYKGTVPPGTQLTEPVFDYGHDQGCSVTGGFVYRGKKLPEFQGVYLFADYCTGKLWGLLKGADGSWQTQKLFDMKMSIPSFAQDADGEIYALDQRSGGVYQLQAANP